MNKWRAHESLEIHGEAEGNDGLEKEKSETPEGCFDGNITYAGMTKKYKYCINSIHSFYCTVRSAKLLLYKYGSRSFILGRSI